MCFNLKPISNTCSSLEGLVKVFSEVILERIDVNETLSSTLKAILRQGRVPIPQNKILQGKYRKRELAVPSSMVCIYPN